MKSFLGFFTKETLHIFRDKRTLLILFGLPLIQLLLFGFALRNDLKDIDLAVLDLARTEESRQIQQRVFANGYFVLSEELESEQGIERTFQTARSKAVLVIRNNGHRLEFQTVSDATDPNTAQMISGYVQAVLMEHYGVNTPFIRLETRLMYNPTMESSYGFVPGLFALILMLISALMTSITITREKEFGTMEMLLVSPLHPMEIIVGKVLPYLLLSFVNVLSILLVALFVFHMPFRGNLPLFFFESLLYVLTALALGMFISTITDSQQVAMMISLAGLLLPTIILSGFMFPIDNMPLPLRVISNVIPATWYLSVTKAIMLKGAGLELLWKETLILTVMAVGLLTISIRKFQIRLQ